MATKTAIPRTVKHTLVESLRDEIIRGDLVPGQYLRLEEIAPRFDVSTMPVREALRDLEAEGLVTIFPHRGATVTQLTADELQDIYDIRVILEEMAARLAVPHLTPDTLSDLCSIVDEMEQRRDDVAAQVKLNVQFHITLYAASGRKHLCELNRILRNRTMHYLHLFAAQADSGQAPRMRVEHRDILAACTRGDADEVAALIRDHVAQVGRSLVEFVRQREEGEASADRAG
jgi:DNA-binding GntR family transcriptional regulator